VEWKLVIGAIRRGTRAILALAVIGLIAGALIARASGSRYQALSSVSVSDPNLGSLVGSQSVLSAQQYVATQVGIMESNELARKVAASIPGMTMRKVESSVKISERGSSDLIDVTARSHSAAQAAALANGLANEYVSEEQAQVQGVLSNATGGLQKQLKSIANEITGLGSRARTTAAGNATLANLEAESAQLSQTINQLQLTSRLDSTSAVVVNAAITPPYPLPDHTVEFGLAGLAAGAALGAFLAVLIAAALPRLRDLEEIEAYFGFPVAADLSVSAARGATAREDLASHLTNVVTYIEAAVAGRSQKTVLCVSVDPTRGPSEVVDSLARLLTGCGRVVDVVTTDHQTPLVGRTTQSELARRVGVPAPTGATRRLTGGNADLGAIELFGVDTGDDGLGQREDFVAAWLREARIDAEVVIFDGGYLRSSAAALILAKVVDVVVLSVNVPTGNERQITALLRSALTGSRAEVVVVTSRAPRSRRWLRSKKAA